MWDKKPIDHARLYVIINRSYQKVSSSFFQKRGNIDKKKTKIFPIRTPNQHKKTLNLLETNFLTKKIFKLSYFQVKMFPLDAILFSGRPIVLF